MTDLQPLLPEIEAIIRTTADFIRTEGKNFDRHQVELKGRNDLVSYVDKTAEKMLKDRFKELLPGAGYINEEGDDEIGENAWRWIIDPLDGTNNFVHGVPVFSVSVALQYEEITQVGFVYEINRDEMFQAILGRGATLNGRPIQVSPSTELSDCLVATGFPYRRSGRLPAIMAAIQKVLENCRGVRRLGSAAVDLAFVACGRYEIYYERYLNPWDMAAGILLVQEAGGKATDFKGTDNALFGKQIVASNGNVHDQILGLLEDFGTGISAP